MNTPDTSETTDWEIDEAWRAAGGKGTDDDLVPQTSIEFEPDSSAISSNATLPPVTSWEIDDVYFTTHPTKPLQAKPK